MSQSKTLAFLAGTALSLGGVSSTLANTADVERALHADLSHNAASQASLLQSSGNAGHNGNNFFLAGNGQELKVGGQIQFRYIANFRDDDNADDFESGFQLRRTKIYFAGDIGEGFDFKVQLAADRDGGTVAPDETWIGYNDFDGTLKFVRFGQFKAPLLREELVSSKHQLAVERSVTNEFFTTDYTQGIWFHFEDEEWTFDAAFSDGARAQNTDFTSGGEADYAVTGRFQWFFEGNKSQFKDFTSFPGSSDAFMVGVAAHWQQGSAPSGSNTNAPGDTDMTVLRYTADASYESDGWNLYGAFIGQWAEMSTLAGGESDFTDMGLLLQGGFFVNDETELFARWDCVGADDDRGLDEDVFNFLTFGVNHYFAGHAAKATFDVVIALNETDPDGVSLGLLPDTGVGLLGDMESGEFAGRAQLQLLY